MIDVEEILSKMNPNQKINYDRVMQKMVKVWEADQKRPTILMHTCCAPCSTYTLEYLTQYADVTVYFANSNIHPKAEYQRRAYVAQKFVHDFNENTGNHVQYLEAPYEPQEFFQTVHGLEEEPEGGDRCKVCFDYRQSALIKIRRRSIALELKYRKFMQRSIFLVISRKIKAISAQSKCARSTTFTANAIVVVYLQHKRKELTSFRLKKMRRLF